MRNRYLFAYFLGNEPEQERKCFAVSDDGYHTIISTNLEMEQIAEKYTQRVASRIMGSTDAIYFCGKDIRQMD